MTKSEIARFYNVRESLAAHNFTGAEHDALRRIAMTLHSWSERECGNDYGCIERDEATGRPFWRYSDGRKGHAVRDMEKGALARLSKIQAAHPGYSLYVQGDPRGGTLYLIRPGDVPEGKNAESYYTRGIFIY